MRAQIAVSSLPIPPWLLRYVVGPNVREDPAGATVFTWTLYLFEEGSRGWENWGPEEAQRGPLTLP